jgi:DNA helicase-2/ATP-dependent DNA helicase PcrA
MELKNALNPAQYEAVTTTDGPLLILAGAGSGKTRVIIHRIAYLIRDKKVAPYNIMAVTFTIKAAQEMQKRITAEIGSTGEQVFIRTFHSAAVFILRRYGSAIGLPSTFSIYDSSDQETVIKEILSEMNIDVKKVRPSYIASKISEIKTKLNFLRELILHQCFHVTFRSTLRHCTKNTIAGLPRIMLSTSMIC